MSAPEHRLDDLGEEGLLPGLPHLDDHLQPHAGGAGDADRALGTLVGVHPAEEHRVAAAARAERVPVYVDAVVDDVRDLDVRVTRVLVVRDRDERAGGGRCVQQRAGLRGHEVVVGEDHRDVRVLVAGGDGGAEDGVVVDDVDVVEGLVGREDVLCLRDGEAHGLRRLRQHRQLRGHGAGGLGQGEEPDVVTSRCEPPRDVVDDQLGAAVVRRWYGNPRCCDQTDAHALSQLGPRSVLKTGSFAEGPPPVGRGRGLAPWRLVTPHVRKGHIKQSIVALRTGRRGRVICADPNDLGTQGSDPAPRCAITVQRYPYRHVFTHNFR